MNLIIVESPTKARTLSRFLGSGYDVTATMGHIKDLPKSKLGIDVKNDFKPEYVPVPKKTDVIKVISDKARKAENIYIATDPDREGEAIASHVKEILEESTTGGKGTTSTMDTESCGTFRITFHEITKEAVEGAIANPRDIDVHLVDAQIARRVLDRLVGYKLSPLLWKKVRRGLSAGRVQSVAVRLIVEREKEIKAFKSEEYWGIYAELKKQGTEEFKDQFTVSLIKVNDKKADVKNKETADKIISDLKKSAYKVLSVDKHEVRKNPYPPFTTSTMTQAGARIFGWSSKKTMSVAQALYEEGLITYHRTDSTNLAIQAVTKVRDFIKKEYGESYLPEKPHFYKTKSKVAQEAHEAIRPTDVSAKCKVQSTKFQRESEILYDIIWRRFVACQMSTAIYDETTIDVSALPSKSQDPKSNIYTLRASGQVMKFDGWRKILPGKSAAGENAVNLPEIAAAEALELVSTKEEAFCDGKVWGYQKFTEPPARYNEASLIKTLEKLGIGRPSTYAPIISTIQIRNYVEKNEGKFFPTPIGTAVNDFLVANFPDIFEYQFTAEMEDSLDKIANGENDWVTTIRKFWDPFSKKLGGVTENAKRVKIETEKLGRKCPDCKEGELVIRIGRFGKFISCSRFPDCKHTEKFVEKIDMKCPDCKEGDVVVKKTKKGRHFFGCSRYPDCKWASWRKPGKE